MKFNITIYVPIELQKSTFDRVTDALTGNEELPFKYKVFKNSEWTDVTIGFIKDCKVENNKLIYVVDVFDKYISKIERLDNVKPYLFSNS